MIVVVADDMTGAAEVAGVCLRYGLRVAFATEPINLPDADVPVVATDTRSMQLVDAVKETNRVLSGLKQAGVGTIFKKTDSAIRGYVLAELKAALEIFGKKRVLLIPANPATGRTVVNGIYYVHGIPLRETGFSTDPDFPAAFSEVENLLVDRYHPDISVGFGVRLTEQISVPDATSRADMELQASCLTESVLPAGSAAFFEAYLRIKFPGRGRIFLKMDKFHRKTLIVCGSAHENSRRFIQEAKQQGIAVVEMPENLLSPFAEVEGIKAWTDEVVSLLEQTNKVLVSISPVPVSFEGSSSILKNRMATMVKTVLDRVALEELCIEGGATAIAIVRKAGFTSFTPVNELSNGVVRMKVSGEKELFMTVKPGSYQWPEKLFES